MCGIAGFVGTGPAGDRRHLAAMGRRMAAALRHRGPDGEGVYVSADATVMLAATRLAVRDRTPAGHQPMTSPDGLVTLVYNGELYRDRDRGARPPPWPARSRCDTEEFLQVVHAAGDDPGAALAGLDAMFAAAWHDLRTGRVHLARDHFGIKPLLYARVPGGLVFASEAAALYASGLLTPAVDPLQFVHRAFVRMDAADGGSWLAGVHAVEPAQLLVVDRDRVTPLPYWRPVAGEEPVEPAELAAAFRTAVAIRRPADVPMAAVLSGGVDSSAVFATLCDLGTELTPYVVRYEGGGDSQNEDVPYALEMAATRGREPRLADIAVADVDALTRQVVPHLARPFLHGAELALFRTYRAIAADGAVVVFSGHGSDELWGYQEGRYFPIVDPARPLDTHGGHYLRTRLYRDERPGWHAMLDRLAGHLGVAGADVEELVHDRTLAAYRELDTLDPVKRGRYHLMRRFLVYVNGIVDACSSAFSLEDRPPFQDVTLAGLAFGMPEYVKNRHGIGQVKPFLKEALREVLPERVLHRPKKGFPAPDDAAFAGTLRALVRDRGTPFDFPLSAAERDRLGTAELMFVHSARCWLDQLDRWRTATPRVLEERAAS